MKLPRRPDKAVAEAGRPQVIEGVVTNERARLPCGCCCYVGRRIDGWEVATLTAPCSEAHVPLVERFNQLLLESLVRPRKVLLVKVCCDLLSQAARELL